MVRIVYFIIAMVECFGIVRVPIQLKILLLVLLGLFQPEILVLYIACKGLLWARERIVPYNLNVRDQNTGQHTVTGFGKQISDII